MLPLLVAWSIISLLAAPSLQNDDHQLYFMLCNGGTGSIPFSPYIGTLYGRLLVILNSLNDCINWHLVMLHVISSMASLGLNYFAASQWAAQRSDNPSIDFCRITAALSILCYLNFQCIYCPQYTHTAILCSCSSLLLLYLWWTHKRSSLIFLASLLLFIFAYELRTSALVAFAILGIGVLAAAWHQQRNVSSHKPAHAWLLIAFPSVLVALSCSDYLSYAEAPDWTEARNFCKARVEILDQRDNSGIDKSRQLQQAGIEMNDFRVFQSFTYVPGFCNENAEQLDKIRQIHQSERIGLFNNEQLARLGFLSFKGFHYPKESSFLRTITPYVPMIAMLVLLAPGINRRTLMYILPVMFAILLYFTSLLLFQRPVGRAWYPVLYTGSVWLMGSPSTIRASRLSNIMYRGALFVAVMSTLFCLRHCRHAIHPDVPIWKYYARNADKLYLTTSMQGLGLFPPGWSGVSLKYFSTTNIIPISDGWCFYSPAYHAALHARGIKNPYTEICKPDTYIVTQSDRGEKGMLNTISSMHESQIGTPLRYRQVETVGRFTIWKAEPAN